MRAPWSGGSHRRARNVTVVIGVVGVALAAGIGTASASDRGRWGRHHKPRPSATATRTASPAPSGTVAPSASTSAAASASAKPTTPPATTPAPTKSATGVTPPQANAGFDYQIGQAYAPPSGVSVVSRDREAAPAAGVYNICYINAFQAQPGELSGWKSNHDDLLLKRNGSYVVDGGWNEVLLDISTSAKRDALTAIVGGWMDGCRSKGFKAVEFDNLDSWGRSQGTLTQANAVAYATQLAGAAHTRGLAAAQKNTVEIAKIGKSQIGFDFAIAEECADYEISNGVLECQGYVDAYQANVIVVEYSDSTFQKACGKFGSTLSIVRRDRNVTAPGSSSYVFKSC
jgi:hypothetical protein